MALPGRVSKLVGSKWTSVETRAGWRHFEVLGVQRVERADGEVGYQAELAASCDRSRRVMVNANELLTREGWQPGWTRFS